MVPPIEGNEVTRDGCRGIGASHSTAEGGEPSPRGPSGGKGELDTWTHCEDRRQDRSLMSVSTKLQWIAEMAKEHPTRAFTNLAHYIDLDFLREAFCLTRKDGAPGIDGVTGEEYEKKPGGEPPELSRSLQSGRYRAPDVRRVHIPKGKGKTRPLGIPTFEDKVLQRGRGHDPGGGLRAGLLALLVRIPARAIGTRRACHGSKRSDGDERWMGRRSGHQRLLRQLRSRMDAENPGPTDT